MTKSSNSEREEIQRFVAKCISNLKVLILCLVIATDGDTVKVAIVFVKIFFCFALLRVKTVFLGQKWSQISHLAILSGSTSPTSKIVH